MQKFRALGALLLTLGVFWCLLAAPSPLQAQATPSPKNQIENWDRTAAKVEGVLKQENGVASETLEALRAELIDQRGEALTLRDDLQRRLTPLGGQLDALGPAPEDDAAKDREVEERRKQLLEQISDLEARQKEVGLVLSRAAALEEQLARRQRLQFTDLLFTRGAGPFDAGAWGALATDAPRLAADIGTFFHSALQAFEPLGAHVLITLAICLSGVIALLSWRSVLRGGALLAQAARRQSSPSRKALLTALEFLLRAGPIPLIAIALVAVTRNIAAPGETGGFVLQRLAETAALLSALAVLSYLALRGRGGGVGGEANSADRWLVAGVVGLAIVFALDWLALDFLERASASLGTLSIANGLVASLAAASLVAIAFGLHGEEGGGQADFQPMLTGLEEESERAEEFGLSGLAKALLRTLLLSAALILIVAALSGYYALSRYVLTGVTLTGLLAGAAVVLYVAFTQADTQREGADAPPAQVARPFNTLVGMALVVVSAPLLALSWGASSADISSALLFLSSDIDIGGVVISIRDIFVALMVLLLGVWATRLVQRFLRAAVLRGAGLAPGASAAIDAGVGYVGVLLALLMAISAAGINLSNLAIIAGALSVGIGFGLQNVVSNFVSGLILLIERPIQPGDWIEVGGYSGNVKRINVRSTEITTFDRASVIVPNSELIAASVVNWTHRSLIGRAIVKIGVGYDSDPDLVARILNETAQAHPNVLKNPAPWIVFADFGASSLDFELRCYLRDITSKMSVESDLRFALLKRLREENVEIPFPQRVVEVKGAPGPAFGEEG